MNTTEDNTITLETALGSPYKEEERGLAVLALANIYQQLEDKDCSKELMAFAFSFLGKERTPLSSKAIEALHDNVVDCSSCFAGLKSDQILGKGYFDLTSLLDDQSDLYRASLLKAAQMGHSTACFLLGTHYLWGTHGFPCDLKKAEVYLKKGARLGSSDCYWGLAFVRGNGKIIAESLPILEKGLAKDSGFCARELGQYYEALETAEGYEKAIFYYAKAAEQDDPQGTYAFSRTFLGTNFKRRDLSRAEVFMRRASDLGSLDADYALGMHYRDGDFGETNYSLSEKYFFRGLKAHDLDCVRGLAILTIFYTKESKNQTWARNILLRLSNEGDSESTYRLAQMAYFGLGEEVNYDKALAYDVMATSQGNALAAYEGGKMCYEGKLVKKNDTKALSLLTYAAEQDLDEARDLLSQIYEKGDGEIMPDPELAKRYDRQKDGRKA